jgi:ATP/maltotriose-dependent transcriptional regulator MalT
VDYLAARYVIGARLRAAHGDRDSAVERLSAGMRVAEQLGLQRLAAAVNNERIRLGIDIAPAVADRLRAERIIPRDDGIARMTAELDEDSGIRLLFPGESDGDHQQACLRAHDLLAGTDGEHRPLAALSAQLLLAETLTASGRVEDAAVVASDAAARCEAVGLSQLAVDARLR